jgi:hypothetical protein
VDFVGIGKETALDKITVMKNLKPSYNKDLILSRLGYDKTRTELSADAMKDYERLFKLTEKTLQITAAYCTAAISDIDIPRVILKNGIILSGLRLSELLRNCDEALIMLATGGQKIMELIRDLQLIGRMSDAVVVDAAASEITDSALDVVMSAVSQKLRPKGKSLTKMRFSPGYGDFDITQQIYFYKMLNAESFGIAINEACLLIPEKSVFAIAGIGGTQ